MIRVSLVGHLTVDLDRAWDEFDIRDIVLVGLVDVREDKLLHFDGLLLLALVLFITLDFSCISSGRLGTTLLNDVLSRGKIPRDQLTIDTATDNNFGVLWCKFDSRHFNWRLKGILREDHLGVGEVKDQNLGLERFTHDLSALFEAQLLNNAHGNKCRLLRVELDICNGSVLRIASLVKELTRHGVRCVDLCSASRDIVTQLLEIVLEHIDDFVRLKLALNAWRNTIDESVELLRQFSIFLEGVLCAADEVLRIVRGDLVNTSVVVCLRLAVDHLIGGLEADFKFLAVQNVRLTALLGERFKIIGAFTWLFIDHLTIVVVAKLFAFHSDASLDKRPT